MYRNEAIKKWSTLYGRQISETEYDEICRNLSGFFHILNEWNAGDRKSESGDKL